jgi:hypothetical protein
MQFKPFTKDHEEEAVGHIKQLRLEQILMCEGETYDWVNLM